MASFLPGIEMSNAAKLGAIEPIEVVNADHDATTLREFSRDIKQMRRQGALRKNEARLDRTV